MPWDAAEFERNSRMVRAIRDDPGGRVSDEEIVREVLRRASRSAPNAPDIQAFDRILSERDSLRTENTMLRSEEATAVEVADSLRTERDAHRNESRQQEKWKLEAYARITELEGALERIVELDDERGWERRRTVTLNRLIEDARQALTSSEKEE